LGVDLLFVAYTLFYPLTSMELSLDPVSFTGGIDDFVVVFCFPLSPNGAFSGAGEKIYLPRMATIRKVTEIMLKCRFSIPELFPAFLPESRSVAVTSLCCFYPGFFFFLPPFCSFSPLFDLCRVDLHFLVPLPYLLLVFRPTYVGGTVFFSSV